MLKNSGGIGHLFTKSEGVHLLKWVGLSEEICMS